MPRYFSIYLDIFWEAHEKRLSKHNVLNLSTSMLTLYDIISAYSLGKNEKYTISIMLEQKSELNLLDLSFD